MSWPGSAPVSGGRRQAYQRTTTLECQHAAIAICPVRLRRQSCRYTGVGGLHQHQYVLGAQRCRRRTTQNPWLPRQPQLRYRISTIVGGEAGKRVVMRTPCRGRR